MKTIVNLRSAAMAALILLVAIPLTSDAQIRYPGGRARAARWYRAYPARVGLGVAAYRYGYGYGYGSPWGYGQTVEGARLRGMAQVIRAQGLAQRSRAQAQYARSQAALNYQQSQRAYIANQKAWNAVYRERVEMARERRAHKHMKLEEQRQRIRANRAKLATHSGAPDSRPKERLTASQLDPYTGKINWPKALLFSDGIDLRLQIEELFVVRIHSGRTNDLSHKIRSKIREFEKLLKKRIRSMPSHEYFAAKSFLELMARETVYSTD